MKLVNSKLEYKKDMKIREVPIIQQEDCGMMESSRPMI
jgi:hypothetical protein